jgi:hypothetical protein
MDDRRTTTEDFSEVTQACSPQIPFIIGSSVRSYVTFDASCMMQTYSSFVSTYLQLSTVCSGDLHPPFSLSHLRSFIYVSLPLLFSKSQCLGLYFAYFVDAETTFVDEGTTSDYLLSIWSVFSVFLLLDLEEVKAFHPLLRGRYRLLSQCVSKPGSALSKHSLH